MIPKFFFFWSMHLSGWMIETFTKTELQNWVEKGRHGVNGSALEI